MVGYAQSVESLSSEMSSLGQKQQPQEEPPIAKLAEMRWKNLTEKRSDTLKTKNTSKKTRKLEIWSYIAFLNPVYIDWAPRENVWEVVGYQFKKGYQLKSVHTGACRTLNTNDNRKVSQNCLPYYRVDAPIQLVDNSKPTLLAQKNVYELY